MLSFYTEPALFPFNTVVGVTEDSHDCLYFASQSGLIKYNGVSFEKYEHIPFDDTSIQSSQIQTIYMDANDVLWLGTYNGLDRFDTQTGTISHYLADCGIITAILRDSRRRLWVGTLNGLYLCANGSCMYFIPFNTSQSISFIGSDTIHALSEDTHGIIYASTNDGVWQYNENTGAFERCSLIPKGCPAERGVVYHFIEDTDCYWTSVWGTGLVRIDSVSGTYETYSLPDSRIYSLYNNFTSAEYIAAGTKTAVYMY
ncbi:two-component regulator propeller domain-containing protein [Treponema vincentii]|nr:two-component regulator propeller domain-containing protein [Treponema vincentii]